jgi:hypothetical protein
MTTDPHPAEGRIPWRRGALALGAVASAAWVVLLVMGVAGRGTTAVAGIASWIALVLSFGTTYLLTRMWSHPSYAGNAQAVLGRRLSAAFEILVAVIVVLALSGMGVPLQLVLGYTAVACFLAALVLALPRPTAG